MKFRFTRTGARPVDEIDNECTIRDCFIPCTQQVKDKLDKFFKDTGQKSVTFKFDGQVVEIRREEK